MTMRIEYSFIGLIAILASFVHGSPEPTCAATGVSFYRDATNCTKFYECNRGVMITLECRKDMYFNDRINACDNPKYVDCDPVCPYPSDSVDLFYDPKNCSRYYECNRGERILGICPAELPYWNHIGKYCDFELYVDCSRGGSSSTTSRTVAPTTSATSGTTGVTVNPDPDCNGYSASEEVSLVYPPDCSKYFLCHNGKRSVLSCPEGLFFNDVTALCDFRDNVSCAHATTLNPYPITSPGPTKVTSPPTTTTAISGTSRVTSAPDPECSSYAASEKVSLVYPVDCSKYYLCYEGQKSVQSCPEGLFFDDLTQKCDFRDNVSCAYASTVFPYSTTRK